MKRAILALAVASLVSGCAIGPTPQQGANADYGNYPENYEQVVRAYYDQILKDPESVRYRGFTQPVKYWVKAGWGAQPIYGYLTCVTLNAKNAYGAYVGYSTDGLIIYNGRVAKQIEGGEFGLERVC